MTMKKMKMMKLNDEEFQKNNFFFLTQTTLKFVFQKEISFFS